MNPLDVLQLAIAGAIGFVAICRLHMLYAPRNTVGAIAAQMFNLAGAAVLGLGPWLPGSWADPATVPSVLFSGSVLVVQLLGRARWRDGAPADTVAHHRHEQRVHS